MRARFFKQLAYSRSNWPAVPLLVKFGEKFQRFLDIAHLIARFGWDLVAVDPTVFLLVFEKLGILFNGDPPLGISFAKDDLRFRVVGVVGNAPYERIREPALPVAYVPFHSLDNKGAPQPMGFATFIVRTASANPLALASTLRREVPRARPGFRVSNIRTQQEINAAQTVRERLLAMLASFFAVVALMLAGIGLYGVLDYSVLQRRREIGIRIAIGAPAGDIARRVTLDVFSMVVVGALAGLVLSLTSARYIESLLYATATWTAGWPWPRCAPGCGWRASSLRKNGHCRRQSVPQQPGRLACRVD
jgi:hypothetical protein